ncbi:hypothetical protein L218DRAFT_1080080 [Marasmius fiardii PR-910]|nr:hypothetical protein L218DRAFT_1080080 [Marasmius fiardii PR-910]
MAEESVLRVMLNYESRLEDFTTLQPDHFKSISTLLDSHFHDPQTSIHEVEGTEINGEAAKKEETSEGAIDAGDDSEASDPHMQIHAMEDSQVFCNGDGSLQENSMELQVVEKNSQSDSSGLQVLEEHSGNGHSITPSELSYRAHTMGEELREVGGIGADNKV